jgi:hypothetical protein
VKDPLDHFLRGGGGGDQIIPEASSCKYLGIIVRSDLSWADQVSYIVQNAWKALHFIMHYFKKGNSYMKSLAYMSLMRPILGYGPFVLGPVQGRLDKRFRQCAKERG